MTRRVQPGEGETGSIHRLQVVPPTDDTDDTDDTEGDELYDESVIAIRRLAVRALGSGETDVLRGMLSSANDEVAFLAEVSFSRDSHISAALTRLHERLEAGLQLAELLAGTAGPAKATL